MVNKPLNMQLINFSPVISEFKPNFIFDCSP